METKLFKINLNGQELCVEFNGLAERSNGSVFVKYGDTVIMANCVIAKKKLRALIFFL